MQTVEVSNGLDKIVYDFSNSDLGAIKEMALSSPNSIFYLACDGEEAAKFPLIFDTVLGKDAPENIYPPKQLLSHIKPRDIGKLNAVILVERGDDIVGSPHENERIEALVDTLIKQHRNKDIEDCSLHGDTFYITTKGRQYKGYPRIGNAKQDNEIRICDNLMFVLIDVSREASQFTFNDITFKRVRRNGDFLQYVTSNPESAPVVLRPTRILYEAYLREKNAYDYITYTYTSVIKEYIHQTISKICPFSYEDTHIAPRYCLSLLDYTPHTYVPILEDNGALFIDDDTWNRLFNMRVSELKTLADNSCKTIEDFECALKQRFAIYSEPQMFIPAICGVTLDDENTYGYLKLLEYADNVKY